MLNPFEPFFPFFSKIDLWSHQKFLPKNDFIFIRKLKSSFISKLIIRYSLMLVFQKMTMLMFDFSHYFLHNYKCTILPQLFIYYVRLFWFTKLFLYWPWVNECLRSSLVMLYPPTFARIIPFVFMKPSITGTTWVYYAPMSTTNELSNPKR